jgi:hypothetical protein
MLDHQQMPSRPPYWTLRAAVAAPNILSETVLAPSTLYRPLWYTISARRLHSIVGMQYALLRCFCLEALQTKRISLRAGGYGSERHDPQRVRGVFAAGERSMAGGWPAGRFAKVGSDRKFGAIIASMPTSVWPLEVATTIATPLIALLPTQAANLGQSPLASAYGTKAGRIIRIGLVLAAVAFAVAFQTGVFTTFDAPEPDGTSVASFAVAPRSLPGLIITVRSGSMTAGDSPTACRWRSEDVASARDACRFLGLAFQSCSASQACHSAAAGHLQKPLAEPAWI